VIEKKPTKLEIFVSFHFIDKIRKTVQKYVEARKEIKNSQAERLKIQVTSSCIFQKWWLTLGISSMQRINWRNTWKTGFIFSSTSRQKVTVFSTLF